jgi:hypothetical protein
LTAIQHGPAASPVVTPIFQYTLYLLLPYSTPPQLANRVIRKDVIDDRINGHRFSLPSYNQQHSFHYYPSLEYNAHGAFANQGKSGLPACSGAVSNFDASGIGTASFLERIGT